MKRHIIFMLMAGLMWSQGCRAEKPPIQERVNTWMGEMPFPSKNYVKNGSFEDGMNGWMYFQHRSGGVDSTVSFSGRNSFRMDGEQAKDKYIYLYAKPQGTTPLEPGKTYTLSAMLKAEGATASPFTFGLLFVTNYGWTKGTNLKVPAPTTDWTKVSTTFVAPETKPRPDGKPTYSVVVFWPPDCPGKVWLDNIQIEEGDKITEYSDIYVGDAFDANERLQKLMREAFIAGDTLAGLRETGLVTRLKDELSAITAEAEKVRDDLKRFDSLAQSAREGLVSRIDAESAKLAGIKTLVWLGPAHIPLHSVTMPGEDLTAPRVEMTCLQGEHRDIAVNVANMTSDGYPGRISASELYNEPYAFRIQPEDWLTIHAVPLIRGFQKTSEAFTDPLPRINDAGTFQVLPASISQVIVSIDTSGLPPGDYSGTVSLISLLDGSNRHAIPVKLKVLPVALLPLDNIDIAECFGHVEYAWDAMMQLGVNTFDVSTQWTDTEFNADGSLKRIDFSRVDRNIVRALAAVPDARFLCFGGQGIFSALSHRYGWKENDPELEKAFKSWVKAIADHLQTEFNVNPSRFIVETYDEPGPADYAAGTKMAHWVREAVPGARSFFYVTGILKEDAWKQNALAHDIPAPVISACTDENLVWLKGLGKKLWVYDCAADGETLHPIAYYRMMPWMCRKYGITGWGHFSWFNTSHGRPYRAWEGVEAQNVVYPAVDGKGMVISRRFLGMRAGKEDYQVLDALERMIALHGKNMPGEAEAAKAFISQAYDKALAMSPREKGYQTHIKENVPADTLDVLRREAVNRIAALLPPEKELTASLEMKNTGTTLLVNTPDAGMLKIRYLVNGELPWQEMEQPVIRGENRIVLPGTGDINRCIVEFRDAQGVVAAGSPLIIPLISVDSVQAPYTRLPLNDGIRMPAVKFEPVYSWISAGSAVEHWVELDLVIPRRVSEVSLYWMTFTGLPQKTMVTFFDRASNEWKPVSSTPEWRPAAGPVETIRFAPVVTEKLRIVQAAGGGGTGGPNLMGLSEAEVR